MNFNGTCRLLLLAMVLCADASANADRLLSDSEDGMTCRDYVYKAHLQWRQKNGDWVDAAGAAYGDVPYATEVVKSGAGQPTSWDVTKLAQQWLAGADPKGGIYMRHLSTGTRGLLDFHSRESIDADSRPVLELAWSDGTESRLVPTADTWLSCAGYKSKGEQQFLRIGPSNPIVLVFPIDAANGKTLKKAKLLLSPVRAAPVNVGVFRLTMPASDETKVERGLAAKYSNDRGIDKDPDVFVATGFESSNWLDGWSGLSSSSNVTLVEAGRDNGFEPLVGKALEVTIKEKTKMGLNTHYRFARHSPGEPEEAYFRYYLRLGDNWAPREGGKLPGLSGTYNRAGWGGRRTDGTNGWSTRGRFGVERRNAGSPIQGYTSIGTYAYHASSDRYGDGWRWNLGPTGLVTRNRWYCVEQYVKLNQPDQTDGEMRAWIDGQLVLEKKGVQFRKTSELKIESLWLNVYHGGLSSAPQDITLYIDNLVIARKYIGPMGK